MNELNHWQVASILTIILGTLGLLACGCSQPKPLDSPSYSPGDDLLRAGCVVRLYQDQIAKEVGDYSAFGIATDEDENGKERLRGVRCGKNVADVLEKLAGDLKPFAASPSGSPLYNSGNELWRPSDLQPFNSTPHPDDGKWEVAKRWPKPYPFVLWAWTWPGRTNEPTVYVESPESQPPKHPSEIIPSESDDFAPGTKNNL